MAYVSDLVGTKPARYECEVLMPIGITEKRFVRAKNEQNAQHLLSHAIGVPMKRVKVIRRMGEP